MQVNLANLLRTDTPEQLGAGPRHPFSLAGMPAGSHPRPAYGAQPLETLLAGVGQRQLPGRTPRFIGQGQVAGSGGVATNGLGDLIPTSLGVGDRAGPGRCPPW